MRAMAVKGVKHALTYVTEVLKRKGFKIVYTTPANYNRNYIVKVRIDATGYTFYLIYQREPFHSFKKYFGVDEPALGIRLDFLKLIHERGIERILWVLEDGSIYMGKTREILKNAVKNKWILETGKTGELVVNYPISLLDKVGLETRLGSISKP
jgi:hypothetical protein